MFAADKAGNVSVAARATVITPRPSPVSLAPNGKLSGSPDLTWNAVTGATYYNVQVFEGTQASKRVAIGWPAVTKYTLPGSKMKKGKLYTWYVWPGIGAKRCEVRQADREGHLHVHRLRRPAAPSSCAAK